MKIVTAEQMRELDTAATERHGIPSSELMERAGSGLADAVMEILPKGGRVLVIAGRGNNGGDGLVAARHLRKEDIEVDVIVLATRDWLSNDVLSNFEKLEETNAKLHTVKDESEFVDVTVVMPEPALIVDAIFGTGVGREVSGLQRKAIEYINGSKALVVSADMPSGISADTGEVCGEAVQATLTATFGLRKRGLVFGKGPSCAGRVVVVDIGIPEEEIDQLSGSLEIIEPADFMDILGERSADTHKGTYGHVVVFAGSGGHLGAGYLTCLAALRSGCGLITYCLPEESFLKFDARYPEIMCDPIPDREYGYFNEDGFKAALEILKGKQSMAIGPAVGTELGTKRFVNLLLAETAVPAVVDADGLNVLDLDVAARREAPTVLTPHPGEMARLLEVTTEEVQADRIGCARVLAERSNSVVVLKGNGTVVASPDASMAINPTGNPGMATAGTGDALTGVVAAFIARGIDAFTAAKAAVYLHGKAGDIAASEIGQESVVATDVVSHIGRAIEEMRSDR